MKQLLLLLMLSAGICTYGRQLYTVKDGNWEADSTWYNGVVPDSIDEPDTINILHVIHFNSKVVISANSFVNNPQGSAICGDDTLILRPGSTIINGGFIGAYYIYLTGEIISTGCIDVGEAGVKVEVAGHLLHNGGLTKVHVGRQQCLYYPCAPNDTTLQLSSDSANSRFYFQNSGQPGVMHFYDFGDGDISTDYGDAATSHLFTKPGTFTVTIIFQSCCGADTVYRTVTPTITPDSTHIPCYKKSPFKIYPNPTDGIVYVENELCTDEPVLVTVYDVAGNFVFSQVYYTTDGYIKQKLNLAYLSSGWYVIDVRSSTIHTKEKIYFAY
ncbi:MAG: T9SS type A sorting domain-containing protein [Chitinophagales bacterium]